jgi:hypothetical protein
MEMSLLLLTKDIVIMNGLFRMFLNTYISYFDYYNKSITFYTKKQLETIVGYVREGEEETIKNILMLCVVIVVLNIILY